MAVVIAGAQEQAVKSAGSRPFSKEELQHFRALSPIDVHAHVFVTDPFISMLKKLNLHILDILVVDDMSPSHSNLNEERNEALSVVLASNGYAALCTSFDP